MWSFVTCKRNKRWLWLALCKQTRQVAARPGRCRFRQDVACVVGGRGTSTCRQLWKGIPKAYKQGILYTDLWEAYQAVLPDTHHQAIGKDNGLTAHVERFNNTLRQRLARFTRKTLSFSKSDHMHLVCLHRFLVRYNLDVIRD
jgi:insertion element IS1 protein InsB